MHPPLVPGWSGMQACEMAGLARDLTGPWMGGRTCDDLHRVVVLLDEAADSQPKLLVLPVLQMATPHRQPLSCTHTQAPYPESAHHASGSLSGSVVALGGRDRLMRQNRGRVTGGGEARGNGEETHAPVETIHLVLRLICVDLCSLAHPDIHVLFPLHDGGRRAARSRR